MAKKREHTYPLNYVSSQLNNILAEMITEYGEEASQKADKATQRIANDFAEKLKKVTPKSNLPKEHIADTIKVSIEKEKEYGRKSKAYIVHYGKWQLIHLLELGWTSKLGKRVNRQPFIRPLFDNNKELYVNIYKEELSK